LVHLASADAEDAGALDDIQAPIVNLLDDLEACNSFLENLAEVHHAGF